MRISWPWLLCLISLPALAEPVGFDGDKPGTPPAGWACGVTGSGTPVWQVQAESSAPSRPNVLL